MHYGESSSGALPLPLFIFYCNGQRYNIPCHSYPFIDEDDEGRLQGCDWWTRHLVYVILVGCIPPHPQGLVARSFGVLVGVHIYVDLTSRCYMSRAVGESLSHISFTALYKTVDCLQYLAVEGRKGEYDPLLMAYNFGGRRAQVGAV